MYQRGLGHVCTRACTHALWSQLPPGSLKQRGGGGRWRLPVIYNEVFNDRPLHRHDTDNPCGGFRSLAALDFPTTGEHAVCCLLSSCRLWKLCQFENERRDRGLQYITDAMLPIGCESIAVDARAAPVRRTPIGPFSSFQMEQRREEQSELLPSQEALREGGELAFPVLDEVALGHELIELLPLLWHHDPRVLFHAKLQAYKQREEGRCEWH